jgi:hypothetical protein
MSPKTKMADDEILERLHLMVDGLRTFLECYRDDGDGRLTKYPTVRLTFRSPEGDAVVLFVALEEPESDEPTDDDEA